MLSGKQFSKEHRTLLRGKVIVTEEQIKENNDIWAQTGRWYEVDEEATEKRNAEQKEQHKVYYAAKRLKVEGAAKLVDAIQGVTAGAITNKPEAAPKDESSEELKAVQQRAKDAGVKSPHLYKSIETLEQKINDIQTEKN